MRVLLILALVALQTQESNETLLQRMSKGRIEEREEATRELIRRGSAAVPALETAAKSGDPELAGRANLCLEKIAFAERLTPGLRTIDGLAERIRRSPREWEAVLTEALPSPQRVKMYQHLGPEDFTLLARKALGASTEGPAILRTLQAVGQLKLVGALEAVEKKAAHSDPLVRHWTARTRVVLAGPRGLEVAEPLLKDPDPNTRNGAVAALGEAKIPGTGARLAQLAADHGLTNDLSTAFWKLRAKEGIPFLEKRCRLPDHMAAMYLSFYAGPEQIPLFRDLLVWLKQDPNTAYNALNHLGSWGDRESIPAIEKAIASDRLWGNCPTAAAKALFLMGATSSQSSLAKLAREGEGRSSALSVLGQMGDRRAIPVLREFLNPPEATAVVALAELEDRESLKTIRELLTNRDRNLREAAATALALLDDRESIPAVAKLKNEADTARRIWPALGQDRPDRAVLTLERDQAVWGGTEYAPQIRYGTNSARGFPRYMSVRAAATARSGASAEMLIKMMKEGGEYGPYAAAALVRMGRREGLETILEGERFTVGLNALRRPAAWKALEGKTTTLSLYAPYRELHRRLAADAGLPLEGPPEGSHAHKAWTDVHDRLRKWGRPPSIAEAFELIEDDRWSVVFEDDRVRIVPRDQAQVLWARWAAGTEK